MRTTNQIFISISGLMVDVYNILWLIVITYLFCYVCLFISVFITTRFMVNKVTSIQKWLGKILAKIS